MYHDELDGRGQLSHSSIDYALAPSLDTSAPGQYGWDDIVVLTDSIRLPSSSAPAYQSVSNRAPLQLLRFANTGNEYVHFTIQLPHSRKPDSDLKWHVHCIPEASVPNGQTISFELQYFTSTPNAVVSATTNITSTWTAATVTATNYHCITTGTEIDGSALEAPSILSCRMHRTATDTFGGNVMLLGTDFHFQRSRLGSALENGTR